MSRWEWGVGEKEEAEDEDEPMIEKNNENTVVHNDEYFIVCASVQNSAKRLRPSERECTGDHAGLNPAHAWYRGLQPKDPKSPPKRLKTLERP